MRQVLVPKNSAASRCGVAALSLALLVLLLVAVHPLAAQDQPVEVIRAVSSLPPDVVGDLREPWAYQRTEDGHAYVFDRRGHSVHRVSPSGESTEVVQIGPEQGRLLLASSFDLGPNGQFVVADAPRRRERVQIFRADGTRIGGFTLPGRATARVRVGSTVLNGIGSLQFTGRSIVMNQPELGGLISEFSLSGHPFRTLGSFRRVHEDDREVALALNSGIPLIAPDGGFYFVFQTGRPVLRRYDPLGRLVYERHIEGRELDPIIGALPTTWPTRADENGREMPLVPTTVRTAAVDGNGNVWVGLVVPVLYVYSAGGDKIRTVRLEGAGPIHPNSLSFSPTNTLLVTPGGYEFDVW